MQPQLIVTDDGSHSLYVSDLSENYHSTRGAIQESMHVFINAGFNFIKKETVNILEIGFGSGLNALLTLLEATMQNRQVYYEAIEAYPIEQSIWEKLNYNEIKSSDNNYFNTLHTACWDSAVTINTSFRLQKIKTLLVDYRPIQHFDLIYFDAFAPTVQPEMWTHEVFAKMAHALIAGGVLVTYSSKGMVKQHLRNTGFIVERLSGAGGKRHMLRATKPIESNNTQNIIK